MIVGLAVAARLSSSPIINGELSVCLVVSLSGVRLPDQEVYSELALPLRRYADGSWTCH